MKLKPYCISTLIVYILVNIYGPQKVSYDKEVCLYMRIVLLRIDTSNLGNFMYSMAHNVPGFGASLIRELNYFHTLFIVPFTIS